MPRYTKTAMLLHWLMAILIALTFAIGVSMTDIPGLTPTKLKYFAWHKWAGVTVLGLACLRVWWRSTHPTPPYPIAMPQWQEKIAGMLHTLLYVLIIAVPVSGYLYTSAAGVPVVYLGLWEIPSLISANTELKPIFKLVHYCLNVALFACVVVHLLAVLKHRFVDRDEIHRRMLP